MSGCIASLSKSQRKTRQNITFIISDFGARSPRAICIREEDCESGEAAMYCIVVSFGPMRRNCWRRSKGQKSADIVDRRVQSSEAIEVTGEHFAGSATHPK